MGICWSLSLFGIFQIELCIEFSLMYFGTAKKGCVIKKEMFSILPVINISVTIRLSLLILGISASYYQKQLIFGVSYFGCILQYFGFLFWLYSSIFIIHIIRVLKKTPKII